jgi:hypothetical protein
VKILVKLFPPGGSDLVVDMFGRTRHEGEDPDGVWLSPSFARERLQEVNLEIKKVIIYSK